jgi:long-chain acyl-CoA synthetase
MITYQDRPWLKHYDPGVPRTLEYPDMPLHGFLEQSARNHPDSVANLTSLKLPLLGRQHSTITYRQLNAYVDALAAGLVDLGLQKGDRVAIVMPNCTQFVIAFYAILKAGGVIAAVNPTYPAKRIMEQLQDSGTTFVITLSLFYNTVKSVQTDTQVKQVIVTNIKEYFPVCGQTVVHPGP